MTYVERAKKIRLKVLDMVYKAQTSHIGSNFSCVDILTVLFNKCDRAIDRLVISKGWVAATAYALAAEHGIIPEKDLDTFCQDGSKYIGLVEPLGFWGCEFAGGSMGLGFPAAVGMALAKKIKGEKGRVYCLMSDGEMAIGTTWESALIAAHHRLNNLVVIVDNNGLQAMGPTDSVLNLGDLREKWVAMMWNLMGVDGHNTEQIDTVVDYLERMSENEEAPMVMIADTIKGKGVSFMENNNFFHYKNLSGEEYLKAKAELENG